VVEKDSGVVHGVLIYILDEFCSFRFISADLRESNFYEEHDVIDRREPREVVPQR